VRDAADPAASTSPRSADIPSDTSNGPADGASNTSYRSADGTSDTSNGSPDRTGYVSTSEGRIASRSEEKSRREKRGIDELLTHSFFPLPSCRSQHNDGRCSTIMPLD
jgi:hypothetical protein